LVGLLLNLRQMHAKQHERMQSTSSAGANTLAGDSISCPRLSSVGTARRKSGNPDALVLAFLVALMTGTGCQHLQEREANFFEGAEQGIEDARRYATTRLKNLSSGDIKAIVSTRPGISHVDYTRVHYQWTNVCTVLASTPPCQPYMVMDQRRSR
jgi:hypothetical protein